MTDQQYIEAARKQYGREAELEIDDGALVSRGSDAGAYVAAWVWIDSPNEDQPSEEDPDGPDVTTARDEYGHEKIVKDMKLNPQGLA